MANRTPHRDQDGGRNNIDNDVDRRPYLRENAMLVSFSDNSTLKADDVIEAIEKETGVGSVYACVPRSGNSWLVCMADRDSIHCVVEGVSVQDRDLICTELVQKSVIVSFMNMSPFVDDAEILQKLEDLDIEILGPIKRHTHKKHKAADGTRHVKVKFPPTLKALPYSMKFNNGSEYEYVRVLHNNQVKVCSKCLSPDHLYKQCPDFVCFRCDQQGHTKGQCTAQLCVGCGLFDCSCPQRCEYCLRFACVCVDDVTTCKKCGQSDTQCKCRCSSCGDDKSHCECGLVCYTCGQLDCDCSRDRSKPMETSADQGEPTESDGDHSSVAGAGDMKMADPAVELVVDSDSEIVVICDKTALDSGDKTVLDSGDKTVLDPDDETVESDGVPVAETVDDTVTESGDKTVEDRDKSLTCSGASGGTVSENAGNIEVEPTNQPLSDVLDSDDQEMNDMSASQFDFSQLSTEDVDENIKDAMTLIRNFKRKQEKQRHKDTKSKIGKTAKSVGRSGEKTKQHS